MMILVAQKRSLIGWYFKEIHGDTLDACQVQATGLLVITLHSTLVYVYLCFLNMFSGPPEKLDGNAARCGVLILA